MAVLKDIARILQTNFSGLDTISYGQVCYSPSCDWGRIRFWVDELKAGVRSTYAEKESGGRKESMGQAEDTVSHSCWVLDPCEEDVSTASNYRWFLAMAMAAMGTPRRSMRPYRN